MQLKAGHTTQRITNSNRHLELCIAELVEQTDDCFVREFVNYFCVCFSSLAVSHRARPDKKGGKESEANEGNHSLLPPQV